jgi:heme exporter protein B
MDLLRQAWAIWLKDLRLEWRTLDSLPAMFFFALLVLVIFNFTLDFTTTPFQELGPGVLWVTFTFAGVLSLSHSFALEREEDCIQGVLLAPVEPGAIYLGKTLSNITMILVMQVILVPLTAVLFNFSLAGKITGMAVVLVIHTLGFAGVGTLLGAITARTRRGDVLLPIILFSVSVPIIISAVKTTAIVLAGRPLSEASDWLTIAGAFDAILLTASFLTFEYVIEE